MADPCQSRRRCGPLFAGQVLRFGKNPFAGRPADILSTERAGFGPFARSVAGASDLPDFPGASASGSFPFVSSVSPNTFATSARTGARQGVLHGLNSGATRCASSSFQKSNCVPRSASSMPLLHRFNEIQSRKERCRDGGNYTHDRGKFSRGHG